MSENDAIRAYREQLPVRMKHPDMSLYDEPPRRWDMPTGITWERNAAMLTDVYLIVPEGERSIRKVHVRLMELADSEE